jgi:hypothetical protein
MFKNIEIEITLENLKFPCFAPFLEPFAKKTIN